MPPTIIAAKCDLPCVRAGVLCKCVELLIMQFLRFVN